MKPNCFKKLAVMLAAVVAMTSVSVPASAATKPGFKSSAATVKVGQTRKYNTANSTDYSVKFAVGNKKIATIKYSNRTKAVYVTGVAAGKTVVKAEFTHKKTKKKSSAKLPVTVVSASKPGFKSTTATVKVGQTKKYNTANAADYSVKCVVGKQKVATIKYSNKTKAVYVTGVAAGKTSVKAEFTHKKTKKVYVARLSVTVTDKTQESVAEEQTVATQTQLDQALQNVALKKLTIKTTDELVFTIPGNDYNNVELIVDAPNADVENAGTFKQITIENIKPSTWKEKGKGNNINVAAKNARVVIENGASVGNITLSKSDAKIAVEVNGSVEKLVVNAKADIALSGAAKNVNVTVAETAKGSNVAASIPVALEAKVEITVSLEKGAEGSSIKVTDVKIKIAVENKTTSEVKITNPEGTQTVDAGKSVNTDTSSSTGTSSSGSATVKYEMESYGGDLSIEPGAGLTDADIQADAKKWSIQYKKAVAANETVSVQGNQILVGDTVIATLSEKTKIAGYDQNGGRTESTANITWSLVETTKTGVYRVSGRLTMPTGWVNSMNRGIAIALVINALAPEGVYNVEEINMSNFALRGVENPKLQFIYASNGYAKLGSTGPLEGSKLSIDNYQLLYDGVKVADLPQTVCVTGAAVKDSSQKATTTLTLSWLAPRENSDGTYGLIAIPQEKENWMNIAGKGPIMTIRLQYGIASQSDINAFRIWNKDDARAVSGGAISDAAAASGSAFDIKYSIGEPNVNEKGEITVNYTLSGKLPQFAITAGGNEGHYLVFSLKRANYGKWAVMDNSSGKLVPLGTDTVYAYAEGQMRLILCVNLAEMASKQMTVYWDADGNGYYDAHDTQYVIDFKGVTLGE